MKPTTRYALVSALLMSSTTAILANEQSLTEQIECSVAKLGLVESLKESPEIVLEHVANAVAANESCAGEIVKVAIEYTKADQTLVAQIVETAVAAAPKQIGEIATFAIATAPDANRAIIASIQKFNAESGTGQAFGFDPTLLDPKAGLDVPGDTLGSPLDFPSGQTQLFVDPKAGAEAPGVGAPGTPVPVIPINDITE